MNDSDVPSGGMIPIRASALVTWQVRELRPGEWALTMTVNGEQHDVVEMSAVSVTMAAKTAAVKIARILS